MSRLMISVLFILSNLIIQTKNVVAQQFNVYFGDLHQHSIYSFDAQPGALAPADAYRYAKHVSKVNFMAISDHRNGLLESNYQDMLAAAQLYDHPDSQFVAIAGQELGSLGSSGYGHMNIFEPLTTIDIDARLNLQTAYQYIINNNLYAQFNHPTTENGNRNFNNLEFYQPVDPFLNSIEVLNGRRSANYERYYLIALAKGWHLGAVGDQDNHAGFYGNNVSNSGDIYMTGVLADSLTKPKILEAINNHRIYAFQTSPATDRMHLTEFTADDHWMGEIFDNDDNLIAFEITAHAEGKFISAQLYKNGFLFKSFEPNSNNFSWTTTDSASFGSVYYFLKLVQEDTDQLWSSSIWVNSSGEHQPADIKITSIKEIRENFPNGIPRRLGWTNITIKGVGTVGQEFGRSGPGYIADSTGGVAVFGATFAEKVIANVPLEFEVTGAVSFFNGQTEIIPYSAKRSGLKTFPEILQVTTGEIASNGEIYEGSLVQITAAELMGNFPPPGMDANVFIDDGSGACILRIDKDTNIPGTATPNGKVNITGVVGQYDTTPPFNTGYELFPRSISDLEVITSIEDLESEVIPESFRISQNYPNPFNAKTQIIYGVPNTSNISLKIYNVGGQLLRTLFEKESPPGEFRISWDGLNNQSQEVSSGVFYYEFTTPELKIVRKLILLR